MWLKPTVIRFFFRPFTFPIPACFFCIIVFFSLLILSYSLFHAAGTDGLVLLSP